MIEDIDWGEQDFNAEPNDPIETEAREFLRDFFDRNPQRVYFSRQLEVQNEQRYFHWITNRAVRDLEAEGAILTERRKLDSGGTVKLVWHRKFRYYKREATKVIDLVNQYSDPNIGAALGLRYLGVRPVIAARMLPKTWINDLIVAGGFALVFKYQLYPWSHRELARTVSRELGLPVDSPRSLSDGTIGRFLRWHEEL